MVIGKGTYELAPNLPMPLGLLKTFKNLMKGLGPFFSVCVFHNRDKYAIGEFLTSQEALMLR